jgi:hypothetical protein
VKTQFVKWAACEWCHERLRDRSGTECEVFFDGRVPPSELEREGFCPVCAGLVSFLIADEAEDPFGLSEIRGAVVQETCEACGAVPATKYGLCAQCSCEHSVFSSTFGG